MGLGTYVPEIAVEAQGGTTVVTVNVNAASNLSGAAVNLRYDSTRYTPDRVEFGDFLGSREELITMALTDRADMVPLGAVQMANTGVRPAAGSGVLARVYFRAQPFASGRRASAFGEESAVDDLRLNNVSSTNATLIWTERNPGDYNQDGSVLVSDLAPIGIYFGQNVQLAENSDYLANVDGSGDNIINVQDLTQIGINFGNRLSGYTLFVDTAGTVKYDTEAITCPRADQGFAPDGSGVCVFNFNIELAGLPSFDFSVAPVSDSAPDAPGPQSNVVSIVLEPGAPVAPTDLTAEGGESVGDRTIRLTWSKSSSADVSSYDIQRKLSTDPDDAFATVMPGITGSTATITRDNIDSTFEEVSYDYRVQVNDIEGLNSLSNVASATPFLEPIVINAPSGLTANPGAAQLSIDLSWPIPAQPAGVTVTGYKIFRKGPGESEFTLLVQKDNKFQVSHGDLALTEGETYEYNASTLATVQGKPGTFESPVSSTVSSLPSAAVSFEILDITTTKWTHHTSGSEEAANIHVTFSVTPDGVSWSNSVAGGALPTGSGEDWTWQPSAGSAKGKQVLTCTGTKGAQSDIASLELIVTSIDLNTSDAGVVGFKAPDFTGSFLNQLNEGGAIESSSLYAETEGKVYLAKAWESW
jgi:hypothetical protein